MNQTNKANTGSGNSKANDQTRPNIVAPDSKSEPDRRETTPEVIHQVTPRDTNKKPHEPAPGKDSGRAPLQAGTGKDREQGQQEPRS